VGELAISIKETKIAKRLRGGNQFFATRYNECISQISGPLGMELERCSAHRVAECQSRGMKCLPRGGALQQLGASPGSARDPPAASSGVDGVTHNRVSQMLQMHPDLVGSAGVELQP
jgi:hypothetical protein